MFSKLLDAVFGCWHSHYSFPVTPRSRPRRGSAACLTGTYVVCLECGKELPYDWKKMKVVTSIEKGAGLVRSWETKEAA